MIWRIVRPDQSALHRTSSKSPSRGATSPAGLSVDAIGDQGGTGKRLAAGECTNACVDRFLAESSAVATGETVPSPVLVQRALCAVTALSALSFGRPQDSPRGKSHRRRSRRETLSSMTTHPGANLVQRLWTSAILNGVLAVILRRGNPAVARA